MTFLKKQFIIGFIAAILPLPAVFAQGQLTRDEQLELIGLYKFVTEGKSAVPTEAQALINFDSVQLPLKCGTPIVASYVMNFSKFDKDLIDKNSLSLATRPTVTDETYDSPGGHFKIHFTRIGNHAVYQPTVTTGGIPNYVIGAGRIFDSVYVHEVDTLGYPKPRSDGGYPSGGDSLYDIYLMNLGGNYYGLTYPDSLSFSGPGSLDATSFIELDNDYQESGFTTYHSRPLDAVRVTAAHEFFHAIHFTIDMTEMEDFNNPILQKRYWFEISAVWMEEEVYDNINDYYLFIPYFFNRPRESIQQFSSYFDFHPYGSCVFAIFLSEKFGRDIIKSIWLKCGTMGVGPNMLEAAQIAIDSASGGTENFRSVFGEFTLWNFFTGARASSAPPGVGYSEKDAYPEIPDTAFSSLYDYPALLLGNANPKNPTPNSAAYFKLNNTRAVFYTDSADTMFRIAMAFGNGTDSALPQGWHINQVNQLDTNSRIYTVSDTTFPDDVNGFLRIANPRQYRSVTFVLAPASWKWQAYSSPDWDTWFGYNITDSLEDSLIDTTLTIDTSAIDVQAAVLTAYPNPAVVNNMGGQNLRFRFQVPTDSLSIPLYLNPYCLVDIYTAAGEYIATCDTIADPYINPDPYIRTVRFEVEWDMRTEVGKEVSSGIYLAVLRLYSSVDQKNLIAEDKAKVLIVR